jgi:hypothetical protein
MWGALAKIILTILGVFGLRADAARDARNADYIKTREKIDEADIVGDDPDAARRWLRERGER